MRYVRILVAGLVASMVMGMIEMLYEVLAGAGFWSPAVFIAATVLRGLHQVPSPVPFLPLPVLLGLMGHMMNSVILAAIFALLVAPRLRGQGELVIAGMVYSLAVFVVMWFGVVPLVDPVLRHLNGLVFAISHLMWGAALGLVLGWQRLPAMALQQAR